MSNRYSQTLSAYCVDIVDKLNTERHRLMNEIDCYMRMSQHPIWVRVVLDNDITIDEKLDELNQGNKNFILTLIIKIAKI